MSNEFDKWINEVQEWNAANSHVAYQVSADIAKGAVPYESPEKGPKTLMYDPFALQYSLGYKSKKNSISYDLLKRIPAQLGVIAAIINTRCMQISSFAAPFRLNKSLGFEIKHKDPEHQVTRAEMKKIKEYEDFIYRCGWKEQNPYSQEPRDDFETFLKKTVRDSLIFDQFCAEVVPDRLGKPYEFLAIDAATMRIAAPEDPEFGPNYQSQDVDPRKKPAAGFQYPNLDAGGSANSSTPFKLYRADHGIGKNEVASYVQILYGQIENVYNYEEMIWGVRNPRTDIYANGYGYGELEQIVAIITSHLNAEQYNARFFTQGSAPKGILNLKGDNITPDQLETFKRQWQANVQGVENCIAGSTRVYTKETGYASVEDICGNRDEVPVYIWTGTSWETGLVYKTTEPKVLCHTELDNGVTLSTSPDHKLRVIGESGEPEWRIQSAIVVGDVVLTNKQDPSAGTELFCLGKKVTPEFMETLGWFLGDGNVCFKTNDRGYSAGATLSWFYHHEKEQDILDEHLAVIQEYFPTANKYVRIRSEEEIERLKKSNGFESVADRVTSISLTSADAGRWFESHGFCEGNTKTVPSQLFIVPEAYRLAYLRGISSADGNCAKLRNPAVTITSDTIREDIKQLFNSVGIRTTLSEGTTRTALQFGKEAEIKPNILRIKDRDAFFSGVGFLQDHKQPVKLKKANEANKMDRVPRSVIDKQLLAVRALNKESGYSLLSKRERMDLNSVLCGSDGCSKGRLLRFMRAADAPIPSWLEEYHTVSVVSVEDTGVLVPMFDVSVDHADHMFVGDNVLISNSWRTPILQSEAGIDWTDLGKTNQEMEFQQWMEYLIRISCAVYLIDPAEINFELGGGVSQTPLFESSNEWKLKASKDRGLKPLLRFIAKLINTHVLSQLDDHFVFDFVGLDEMTEQDKHQMRMEQANSYLTLNEIRRADDRPDIEFGDIPMNPTYVQYAQVQQQNEQMEQQQQSMGGGEAAGGEAGGEAPPEQENSSPQYSDNFNKGGKILEIDMGDGEWLDLVKG